LEAIVQEFAPRISVLRTACLANPDRYPEDLLELLATVTSKFSQVRRDMGVPQTLDTIRLLRDSHTKLARLSAYNGEGEE